MCVWEGGGGVLLMAGEVIILCSLFAALPLHGPTQAVTHDRDLVPVPVPDPHVLGDVLVPVPGPLSSLRLSLVWLLGIEEVPHQTDHTLRECSPDFPPVYVAEHFSPILCRPEGVNEHRKLGELNVGHQLLRKMGEYSLTSR